MHKWFESRRLVRSTTGPYQNAIPHLELLTAVRPGEIERWVDRMINDANRRGGLDNITAIVVKIETVEGPTGEYHVSNATRTTAH